MDVATFIRRWSNTKLSERAASQEHFINLCQLLGQRTPAEHDATGEEYSFEKGVAVSGAASKGSKGERGFADVWWDKKFGWEYKRQGKYKTLDEAYSQLLKYREALNNPPLLIVSDIDRIEIRTNFTGFGTELHVIEIEQMSDPGVLSMLKRVFTDPGSFKPDETAEQVTEKAAKAIGSIAHALRDRGHEPHDTAHFLMKVMFCLFAEDVNLLPKGLFEQMLTKYRRDPARLKAQMDTLFAAMRTGGDFGIEEIAHFNGGLFDEAEALELTEPEIADLVAAASKDWGAVEPSVFGTLFERSLDPAKRAQIGAHYTSREDIMLVIEPVIVRHLRQAWDETKADIDTQLKRRSKATTEATKKKANKDIDDLLDGFQHHLSSVRVLDPACGSGNFLYVAIQQLLALEKEVVLYASSSKVGASGLLPRVRPTQLLGIEISPYAAELAQVVIWIGYLQWMRDNGFNAPRDPILEPINTIENRDAILTWADESGEPIPTWREGATCLGRAEWPDAEYIVGNPPFAGRGKKRRLLSEMFSADYPDLLNATYELPLRAGSDLCCYWFELARSATNSDRRTRCGLLATQGIRNGTNRLVLDAIWVDAHAFFAESDREWILDGATVHVSMIGFQREAADAPILDGECVAAISADLTTGVDITSARELRENRPLAHQGVIPLGSFDPPLDLCLTMLRAPSNVNRRHNSDVIKPWANGDAILSERAPAFIVDFFGLSLLEASAFESPFAYVESTVLPEREKGGNDDAIESFWLHWRPRPGLRSKMQALPQGRYICTPRVSKHRVFVFASVRTLPSDATVAFSSESLVLFGVLSSSIHELWSILAGSQLRDQGSGKRYSHTKTFRPFPLSWLPGFEPAEDDELRSLHDAIADAAKALDEQRERWLNPPELIELIEEKVDEEDDFADVARVSGEEARRLIRQSAIDAAAAQDKRLKKRTLTNLYNERPTWLRLAHKSLDETVLAAYASVDPEGGWDTTWAEVFEETGAGFPLPEGHELEERREEVEQLILGNLLRMNLKRASEEAIA